MDGRDERSLSDHARHACLAVPIGPAAPAIDLARRAGEAAEAVYAFEEAEAHYRRALEVVGALDPVDEGLARELAVRLAAARHHGGNPAGFVELLAAAEDARVAGDDTALVGAATSLPQFGVPLNPTGPDTGSPTSSRPPSPSSTPAPARPGRSSSSSGCRRRGPSGRRRPPPPRRRGDEVGGDGPRARRPRCARGRPPPRDPLPLLPEPDRRARAHRRRAGASRPHDRPAHGPVARGPCPTPVEAEPWRPRRLAGRVRTAGRAARSPAGAVAAAVRRRGPVPPGVLRRRPGDRGGEGPGARARSPSPSAIPRAPGSVPPSHRCIAPGRRTPGCSRPSSGPRPSVPARRRSTACSRLRRREPVTSTVPGDPRLPPPGWSPGAGGVRLVRQPGRARGGGRAGRRHRGRRPRAARAGTVPRMPDPGWVASPAAPSTSRWPKPRWPSVRSMPPRSTPPTPSTGLGPSRHRCTSPAPSSSSPRPADVVARARGPPPRSSTRHSTLAGRHDIRVAAVDIDRYALRP